MSDQTWNEEFCTNPPSGDQPADALKWAKGFRKDNLVRHGIHVLGSFSALPDKLYDDIPAFRGYYKAELKRCNGSIPWSEEFVEGMIAALEKDIQDRDRKLPRGGWF
jgi:hypothetical protein